jgi:hypothetical protein
MKRSTPRLGYRLSSFSRRSLKRMPVLSSQLLYPCPLQIAEWTNEAMIGADWKISSPQDEFMGIAPMLPVTLESAR